MKTPSIILLALLSFSFSLHASDRFEVTASGKGPSLIFVPGLACDGSVWEDIVPRYSEDYQCHVLSLAGFGQSKLAPPSGKDLLPAVADDLANYIEAQQLEDPVLIGHSLGGFIGLLLAKENPELLSRLVIVDSLSFLPAATQPGATVESMKAQADAQRSMMTQGGQSEAALRGMLQMMITDPSDIQKALQMSLASDPQTVAQAMYELNTTDLRDAVQAIKTPTQVLGAWIAYQPFGVSKASTQALFEGQYAKLPRCEIALSDTGRHFIMWDDPDFFFAQVDAVLAER